MYICCRSENSFVTFIFSQFGRCVSDGFYSLCFAPEQSVSMFYVLFLKKDLFLCVLACVHVCEPHERLVPTKAAKGH